MRQIENQTFLTIGEVAKRVGRISQTLKNWLEWHKTQTEETKRKFPLPTPITDMDAKGTRFFREEDVELFEKFKRDMSYGLIADVSITRWGKRGEDIKQRRENAEGGSECAK